MGLPQNPSPPHLYSQELQLRLYQAFIFSIPILFSIILFLLFYLFYLKRRSSTLSSPPPLLPMTLNHHHPHATSIAPLASEMGLKGEMKNKLPVVLFDEDLREKESQCCVCLGEFEMKEELNQVPSCQHVFHVDCISHWLHSNSTCPLCRCSIIDHAPPTKLAHHPPPPPPPPPAEEEDLQRQDGDTATNHHHQQRLSSQQQQQEEEVSFGSSFTNHSREQPWC